MTAKQRAVATFAGSSSGEELEKVKGEINQGESGTPILEVPEETLREQAELIDKAVSEGSVDLEDAVPNYGDGKAPDSLWISEGNNQVISTIYAYRDDNSVAKLRSITLEPSSALRILGLIEFPITATWTIPTKNQLSEYRTKSSMFDRSLGRSLIDRDRLAGHLLRNHLQVLNGPKDAPLLSLVRDKRNRLDQSTMEKLQSLHPTVLDLLVAKFAEDASLLL